MRLDILLTILCQLRKNSSSKKEVLTLDLEIETLQSKRSWKGEDMGILFISFVLPVEEKRNDCENCRKRNKSTGGKI